MQLITHDPKQGVYATDSDWVHAVEVKNPERFLFVSGTMGLDQAGIAGANLEEQLELAWQNIRTILASANMSMENVVRVTSYLRDPSYAGANAEARCRALGDRRVPTTAIVAQTLESDWLVEIEIIAAA